MSKMVEVKLREQGKIMVFNANDISFKLHDIVIVESERGLDFGQVIAEMDNNKDKPEGTIKRIVRVATDADNEQIKKTNTPLNPCLASPVYRSCRV